MFDEKTIFYIRSISVMYNTLFLLKPILSKKYIPIKIKLFIFQFTLFIQGVPMEMIRL
jgi:hypothetical protein